MRILLVEPNYKNKYPPMGLMKISTYHKSKGDYVAFVKGKDKKLAEQMWDRIYITTMFTFHYIITVDTVRFYKSSVFTTNDIYIGGILASLMAEDLKRDTGINNVIVGQLISSRMIGFDEDVNVDAMPLDYDMLDDVEYKYPAGDNYFTYTTRGCPNKCSFCAVPKLEPEFKTVNHIIQQISYINKTFGEKRNLLLLDNNILKSPDLKKIVDDIKSMGFYKGATYTKPNLFPILLQKVNENIEDDRYLKRLIKYLLDYKSMMIHPKTKAEYLLFIEEIIESENPLEVINTKKEEIQVWLEKYKDKRPKLKYVDFNQGIDARLMTPVNMAVLSELPLNPVRIAFDKLSDKDGYIQAVHIAHNCGIRELSNYILYNEKDKPTELWDRLQINIELNERLGVHIYSFPMKYMPIDRKDREYVGKHWCKKYLTGVTAILLVTKGIVAGGPNFFHKAFGNNHDEYFEILSMPREFIIYRFKYEGLGLTQQWQEAFAKLTIDEKKWLLEYVGGAVFVSMPEEELSFNLKNALRFYTREYELKK
ncbi:Radical SAM superfamily protein [Pelotomaculum sp. FP]|uniref:hypothetical protein n=1 Tax=Pelotomaculum sp. FP TaxID=261474 RepID=UPI0010666EFC|nr:hypothetical protein [Pelotomaculum sp. FP]TEB16263.1 Radical SAM superfamily protein [Pelotomaculum sp. FP]